MNARDKMRGGDWLLLVVISLIVSVCGVVGVSYVAGEGEPLLDPTEIAALTAVFTVVAALVIFFMDKLFAWIFRTRHTDYLPGAAFADAPEVSGPMGQIDPNNPAGLGPDGPAGPGVPLDPDTGAPLIPDVLMPLLAEGGTPLSLAEILPPLPNGAPRIFSYGPKDSKTHIPVWELGRIMFIPELAEAIAAGAFPPPGAVGLEGPNAMPDGAANAIASGAPGAAGSGRAAAAKPSAAGLRKPSFLGCITPHWSPISIIVCCLVMAAFWAPWLIANYPGGTYWDTYYQIFQIYPENHPIAIIPWDDIYDQTLTDAWLVDHHPVLTTLLYGAFGWVSDQVTGNWMAGVFAFCALQGAAAIVAFTCALAYLRRRNCPIILCFLAYAFFCVMPFVSTWAMCMVKDSLFGVLCVPYFIMLFEAVRTRGASLSRVRSIVLFCLLGLLLCLTRKMGIFMVVPTALIAAIVLRRSRVQSRPPIPMPVPVAPGKHSASVACLIQALACVLVTGLILPFAVFPAANIAPGGTQEVLGPLFQQTARYMRDHGDEIAVQEKRAVSAVLDYEKLASQYQYDFADSVKYRYNLDATPDQIMEYLRAYVTMGVRHPDSYLAAFASLAGFYVAPTAYANIRMVTVDTRMGETDRYMLWNPSELDEMRHGMDEAYTAVAETPGVNVPFLIVTYAFWLPAGLLFTCMRRRLRCGTLLVPSLILLAFVLISPVYDARYCVPIFDLAPLLVCAFGAIGATMYGDYAKGLNWIPNRR